METEITLLVALAAGALSFLSPCVLPLVPGYLCFIAGAKLEDLAPSVTANSDGSAVASSGPSISKGHVMAASSLFVLGFSTVFIALGASASSLSHLLLTNQQLLAQIAGAAIILFGLHTAGILRFSILNRDTRFHQSQQPVSIYGAYGIGLAFGFGWTPCIGPILAAILSVAAQQQNLSSGVLLLTAYAAGLGIPFLLAALATDRFMGFMRKFGKHLGKVEKVTGVLLVLTGILMLTGGLEFMAFWLLETFPFFADIG